jgi:hypothetical protein
VLGVGHAEANFQFDPGQPHLEGRFRTGMRGENTIAAQAAVV